MSLKVEHISFIVGSLLGVILVSVCSYYSSNQPPTKKREQKGDDDCLSLFYHKELPSDGSGLPCINTCSADEIMSLTTIHPPFKRLDNEFYQKAVENLPIACVDVICQRKSDKKLLLFLRRDKPAAGVWWWPGGRMFRGETFFQAALRKIREETGIDHQSLPTNNPNTNQLSVKSVVHVWNTFFPDSSWDSHRKPGYEGTQTVNIVVFCELNDCFNSDSSSSGNSSNSTNTNNNKIEQMSEETKQKWAVNDHRWVSVTQALEVGLYDKYVRLNVEIARKKKLV